MELDSNEVVKKIEEYRKDYSCSQATLMGICDVAGMPTEELALLAKDSLEELVEHSLKGPVVL